ncbi:hypothetical protein BD410DRAFT_789764 [Rickenella mellea]|uniref:Uncharacterized protein n=1 Tax=Rickenella mellea TaxID=50990 RepID=A0A4Y7Q115_9AGAM|nr:hypothetical protein BD410DRAFT_789764 [Rickenella mellea]
MARKLGLIRVAAVSTTTALRSLLDAFSLPFGDPSNRKRKSLMDNCKFCPQVPSCPLRCIGATRRNHRDTPRPGASQA